MFTLISCFFICLVEFSDRVNSDRDRFSIQEDGFMSVNETDLPASESYRL